MTPKTVVMIFSHFTIGIFLLEPNNVGPTSLNIYDFILGYFLDFKELGVFTIVKIWQNLLKISGLPDEDYLLPVNHLLITC